MAVFGCEERHRSLDRPGPELRSPRLRKLASRDSALRRRLRLSCRRLWANSVREVRGWGYRLGSRSQRGIQAPDGAALGLLRFASHRRRKGDRKSRHPRCVARRARRENGPRDLENAGRAAQLRIVHRRQPRWTTADRRARFAIFGRLGCGHRQAALADSHGSLTRVRRPHSDCDWRSAACLFRESGHAALRFQNRRQDRFSSTGDQSGPRPRSPHARRRRRSGLRSLERTLLPRRQIGTRRPVGTPSTTLLPATPASSHPTTACLSRRSTATLCSPRPLATNCGSPGDGGCFQTTMASIPTRRSSAAASTCGVRRKSSASICSADEPETAAAARYPVSHDRTGHIRYRG